MQLTMGRKVGAYTWKQDFQESELELATEKDGLHHQSLASAPFTHNFRASQLREEIMAEQRMLWLSM